MARVLIVDDDAVSCQLIAEVLQGDGVQVSWETEPGAAIALARRDRIDLAILDMRMPQMNGLALMQALRSDTPDLPVMIMTGFGSMDSAVEALNLGAIEYVSKPMNVEEIRAAVRRALAQPPDVTPATPGGDPAAGMVGRTPAMVEVYTTIARVAPGLSTVLVLGESGTGKELAARAIHRHSPRRERAFVAVDCTALTESLLESELFGHEKGSFTGAVGRKDGRFSLADGGTLFLDEIGELPLSLQAKLLRALQERRFTRVGGTAELETDARVIAASNRNLADEVAAGRFREDLYYRLNVVAVEMPPLRRRREDVPLLVDHLRERFDRRHGSRTAPFSPAVLRALVEHSWPGNVRELANAVERLVLLAEDGRARLEDLPPEVAGHVDTGRARGGGRFQLPPGGLSFEELERDLLAQALQMTAGNRARAARLLGLPYKAFLYRLEKHGLAGGDPTIRDPEAS